jgi:MerR family transcriptional regulator, thiopeptide resistance regulator
VYTVKQLSELAGVSVRTLHYYDEIGLLKPSRVGDNSYRYYDNDALLRLQQILLYREMGMELTRIKTILDEPDFDFVTALRSHRTVLKEKVERLKTLIDTVDTTIMHVSGGTEMSKHRVFQGFGEEQERDNTRAARLQYGPTNVNESVRRWSSYSAAQQQAIMDEGNQIYSDIADALEAGKPAVGAEVQELLVRWHNHIYYFYEPSLDVIRGLGQLYEESAEFAANFQKLHADLPGFLREAITQYVDDLETAELERMLEEDQARKNER